MGASLVDYRLPSPRKCVYIIVVKDNAPPIEQCRSFFGQSRPQPKMLLAIFVRVDGLVARKELEKYHASDIPIYRQENILEVRDVPLSMNP